MAFKMKGMKFYGDRTRKEMRQDIRRERKSLKEEGGTRQDVKEFNKYQRGRKLELRGEELIRRGKTKRGEKKIDKGSSIIKRHKEPSVVTQKVRQFKNKRKHKENLEKKSSPVKNYKKGYYGE